MRPIVQYSVAASMCFAVGFAPFSMAAPVVIAKVAKPAVEAGLPKLALTNQILYEFLVAEIAGQRGDLGVASGAYLDLAQKTRDPRLAKRATEVALFAHRANEARAAASLWLDVQPNSLNAQKALTALLVGDGKLADARPHLEKLIAAEGGNPGLGFMQLNTLLQQQKDKPAALALVKNLAAPYPKLPEAHYAIAQAAVNAGQFDVAMTEIKTAAQLKPGWEAAALFQFLLIQRDGKDNGAGFLKDFLQHYPDAREVRLTYARQLVSLSQFRQARDEFKILAKALPDNPEISLAIGLISLQLNDLDEADTAFKRTLQLGYADQGAVQIYLGQVAEARKQYAEAGKWYQSVSAGKHYLAAQIRYSALLAKQGKLAEARTYLHGVKTDNAADQVRLIQAEAELLRDAKDYQGVYDLLGVALARQPDSPELLYDHAMAAERVNKLDVLEKDLRRLIVLKPDYAHAYNALGYTLADRTDRLGEAVKLLEQALKLAPNDPFILDSMGWAQYRQGNIDASLSYLRRAYSLRADPDIAAHLGEVLWQQGKHEDAHKLWQTSLDSNPQNAALLSVMQKFNQH